MLWRVRTTIDDRPGFLAVLAASLALRSVNILSVQVQVAESGAVDDFLLDAPDTLTAGDISEAVARGRGRDCWIAPADPKDLIDEPTRVLTLAARAIAQPSALGEVLSSLLGTCDVTWCAAGDDPSVPDNDLAADICLSDPRGGVYRFHRDKPSFTPAERARAVALMDAVSQTGAWESHTSSISTGLT